MPAIPNILEINPHTTAIRNTTYDGIKTNSLVENGNMNTRFIAVIISVGINILNLFFLDNAKLYLKASKTFIFLIYKVCMK